MSIDNVDRAGTIMPDIGNVKHYKGPKPNIDLTQLSYDPTTRKLQVKWTASDIIESLKPVIEKKNGELHVQLQKSAPVQMNSTGGFTIGAGGAAMTEHTDDVQLPVLAKGTTIKVWNGDVDAGTFIA